MMTCSSSATCLCSCQTQREPSSNTSLPRRSTTGATWSGSLSGIFRAHTCAQGTPRTSKVVARRQMSLSKTSSDAFPRNAPSCQASVTQKLSKPSFLVPPTETWSESWAGTCQPRRPYCSTSPPSSPQVKRSLGPSSPTMTPKGKRKDEAPGASTSHLPKKKKDRQGNQGVLGAGLVAATERKNP